MITFHDLALVACLWWSCVYSFEALEDCRKTVNLTSVNNSIIYVSNGTAVCFECDYSPYILVAEVVFRINGENVTSSSTMARVVKNETHFIDTLVVSDSDSVFSTSSVTDIQCCMRNPNFRKDLLCSGIYFMVKAGVVLFYVFNPPRIAGETVITEGGRLHLSCDGSNSAPQPTLQWISPDGEVVSESGEFDIVIITRNMTGIYTCVATLPYSNTTMNSTVNVSLLAPYGFPINCTTLSSTAKIVVDMNSTAVGSKATYQCRTDVYTTQCTSHGVWDPHPLSSLDCTESTRTGNSCATYQVGVIILSLIVGIQTGLLVGALVKILIMKRRSEQKTREERLEMDVNVAYGTHKEVAVLRKSKARAM